MSAIGDGDIRIEIAGQHLWLLPERGAFWEERGILLIADPHWGKAATFRARGVPVPEGTTGGTLDRLDVLIERTAATEIVFLGDLLHAREGRSEKLRAALLEWRQRRASLKIMLVRGNHDRHAGDPPSELGVECVNAPCGIPPFVFAHHPAADSSGYVIAGHIHPAVRLTGAGRQSERLPCFLIGQRMAILPAFGEFTGMADIVPGADDRVFVTTGDMVTRMRY